MLQIFSAAFTVADNSEILLCPQLIRLGGAPGLLDGQRGGRTLGTDKDSGALKSHP